MGRTIALKKRVLVIVISQSRPQAGHAGGNSHFHLRIRLFSTSSAVRCQSRRRFMGRDASPMRLVLHASIATIEPNRLPLALRRRLGTSHALGLKAQHHYDVAALDASFKIGKTETPIPPCRCAYRTNDLNSAPRVPRRWMLDRATRLLAMSPQIAIFKPQSGQFGVEWLKRQTWVGCSWRPSPALITAASTYWLSNNAAPEQLCRTTRMSGCIALCCCSIKQSLALLDG